MANPYRTPTGQFTTPAGAMGLNARKYYFDVLGKEKLIQQLRQRTLKGRKTLEYQAGYRAHYAAWVHFDLQAFHPIGKAMFLSDPIRRGRSIMGRIAASVLRKKRSLEEATLAALEWLEAASKEEVPVDTGFLRESWFVRLFR